MATRNMQYNRLGTWKGKSADKQVTTQVTTTYRALATRISPACSGTGQRTCPFSCHCFFFFDVQVSGVTAKTIYEVLETLHQVRTPSTRTIILPLVPTTEHRDNAHNIMVLL